MTTHLALVGEQPMPVLLTDRYLRPNRTVLVCTQHTQAVAERLRRLIGNSSVAQHVAPYDMPNVLQLLERLALDDDVIVNLTGGTKIMMLAAFAYALQHKHHFVYLESERPPQHLHRFSFGSGMQQTSAVLPNDLITADEYLRAHLNGYSCEGFSRTIDGALTRGGEFEQAVQQALAPHFEVLAGAKPAGAGDQIEIDLVIRYGNQVAVAEVKLGRGEEGPKKGIDQLSTAGGREYLGTYTRKLLITAGHVNDSIRRLAAEKHVAVIQVDGYRHNALLAGQAAGQLVAAVNAALVG